MLALGVWEATRCPVCGGDPAECQSPDNERAFKVPPPTRCHRTTAISIRAKDYEKAKHSHALMYRPEMRT